MSSTLLVTGATGFIGRALAGHPRVRGTTVRLLVRSRERARAIGLPPDGLVEGDLDDVAVLERAVTGVDAVVHLAGLTRARERAEFDRVNRGGTRNLAEAVVRAAPHARFVLVSSLAAAGPTVDGAGTDAPPDACRPVSIYGRSKLAGERELLAVGGALDWVVVRPPIVYGPHDDGTRLLFRQACSPIAPVPWRRRPLSLIHVDDLVAALVAALGSPAASHAFLPVDGPDRLDTDSLVERVAEACGRRPRLLRVPMLVPRVIAPFAELASRLRNRSSFFNLDKMREASAIGWVCDAEPARRTLGFTASVDTATGFRRTLADDPALARYARGFDASGIDSRRA